MSLILLDKDNIELYINYIYYYYDYILCGGATGALRFCAPQPNFSHNTLVPAPSPNFRENVIHDHYLKVANLITAYTTFIY